MSDMWDLLVLNPGYESMYVDSGVRGYWFWGRRVLVPGYEGIGSGARGYWFRAAFWGMRVCMLVPGVRGYWFWGTRVLVPRYEGIGSGV